MIDHRSYGEAGTPIYTWDLTRAKARVGAGCFLLEEGI
jgi:hypothetical protein